MKWRPWLWLAFAALCLAQWTVPAMLIHAGEKTLAEGTVWRFRTAPVDPYDPFVGRYVRLSYTVERQPLQPGEKRDWVRGQKVYALLETDEQGFAKFAEISAEPPAQGDYITARVRFTHRPNNEVWLRLPFDRFYMDERHAPAAEQAYNDMQREGREAWTVVRVRDGHAILEELYLDGRPVKDYLLEARVEKKQN